MLTVAAQSENSISWRRPPTRWIAISIAVVLVLIALVWASRSSGPAAASVTDSEKALPLVSVTVPGLRPVKSTVTFIGAVAARYDMAISAEGDGGRIVAVLSESGDRVKTGQVLAKLDQSVLLPQVNRLAAALEESRAQAALSAAEYQRAQSMEAAGALSLEEIERRRAASVTDQARVKVAAAQLAEVRARLSKTELRSPGNGVVLTRSVEAGLMAAPGQVLFRIAGDGEVEMRGQVAERDLALLAVGQSAHVYLTGVATPFEGKVRLLGAVIDPQSRQGDIRIALGEDPALRPGAFARGEVVVNQAQRPVLPQTAVLSDTRGTYVFVLNAQHKIERRAVRVADATQEGIVIAEGLTGRERVVMTAGGFLREGEKVVVAAAKA
jgi:HlyD family secretion protein